MATKWALTTGTAPVGYESTTYTDVETWSIAEGYDLVTAAENAHLSAFDDWASGLAIAEEEIRDTHGWTTDASNKVILDVYDGEGHGGVVGNGFFAVASDVALRPVYTDLAIEGFAFTAGSNHVILNGQYGEFFVNACIFDLTGSTTDAVADLDLITNCLFINGRDGPDNISGPIINCTFSNQSRYPIIARSTGEIVKNNVWVNSGSGIYQQPASGTTWDYNASDDAGVYGTNSISSITVADNFSDAANDDLSVKDTSADIYDAGVDLSATYPALLYDIAGNPRTSTYSIGAYEYASAGAGGINADFVNSSATIYQPALQAGAADLAADFLNSTASIYQATLGAGASDLTTDFLDSTASIYSATLAAGAAGITADFLNSAANIYQPTLDAGAAALTVDFLNSTATIYDQALVAAGTTISADFVDSTASIFQPTLGAGAADLTADFLNTTATIYQTTFGGVATLTADFIDSTATIPQPELSGAGSVVADFINSTATIYIPTLGSGAAPLLADFLDSTAAIYSPTLSGPQTLTIGFFDTAAAIYQPSLVDPALLWTPISAASTSWTEITDDSTTWTEI